MNGCGLARELRKAAVGVGFAMAVVLSPVAQAQLFFTNSVVGAWGDAAANWTNQSGTLMNPGTTAGNWAGSNLVFSAATLNTNNLGSGASLGWVLFQASTTSRVTTAANRYFFTGFTNSGNNTVLFATRVNFTNRATVAPVIYNEGNLTFSGTVMTNLHNSAAITFDSAAGATTTVSGAIGVSTGGVAKIGAGALTLSGANTFLGGVSLTSGTLILGNNSALGGGAFTIGGGTLDASTALTTVSNNVQNWNGDYTFAGANSLHLGTGAVTLGGNRAVTVNGSTLTVGGIIDDGVNTYSLTKLGVGTLVLSGANAYGGGTFIGAGTLQAANAAALPNYGTASKLAVSNGATLAINYRDGGDWTSAQVDALLANSGAFATGSTLALNTANGSGAYAGAITIAGLAVSKLGANTLILSGANSYGGGTTIAGGTLNVTNDSALGSTGGGVTFNGGILQTSMDMTFDNRNITLTGAGTNLVDAGTTLTLTNSIGGAGTWVKAGAGTMVLAGNSAFGAAPLFNEGIVNLQGAFSSGAANLSIGRLAGIAAVVNVQAGTVTGAVFMSGAGNGATGLVYQTGGTVTMGTSVQAGGTAGSYGEYHLYGGTLNAGPTLYAAVNSDTTGVFEMTNGLLAATAMQVGRAGTGNQKNTTGHFYQSGGTATVTTLYIGGNTALNATTNSTGYFAISNGTFSATTFSGLAGSLTSTGRIYLGNGSVVTLGAFPTGRGAGSYAELTMDLNGGSLTPAAASAVYMSGLDHAYLTTNGATFSVPFGRDITILQPFENAPGGHLGTLTKTGSGLLTLSGTNTYGGFTDVRAGALSIATTNSLPGLYASGRYIVSNGAALAVGIAVSDAEIGTILGVGNLAAGAAIGFDTTAGSRDYALSLADTPAGALAVAKFGGNTLTLSGSSGYSGGTLIATGAVVVANNAALGSATAGTTVLNGGRLILTNGVVVTGESLDISGDGADYVGALQAAAGSSGTWAGPITLGANARIGSTNGGVLTISGVIQNGTGSDLFIGAGMGGTGAVILSGTNLYTGATKLVRGTLQLGATDALPIGTALDVDSSTATENAIFDLNGFDQTVGVLQRTDGGGTGASIVTNTGATLSTLTINAPSNATFGGVLAGNLALVKNGAATQTLSGANSYTGTTTIGGGVLSFSRTSNFTNSSSHIAGPGILANAGTAAMYLMTSNSYGGGTLISGAGRIAAGDNNALGTGTVTFNGNGSQLSSDGATARSLANNLVVNTNITLGHGTDNGLLTLNGNVDLGGNNSRKMFTSSDVVINGAIANGGLVKTGSASLTLSGPNTYAGGTSVGQGRLLLGGDNVLGSGALTLTVGAMLSSDGTAPRSLTNSVNVIGASTFGDTVKNGVLTFSGKVDLGNAVRGLTNISEVVVSGLMTNGAFNKSGDGTLTISGSAVINNTCEIFGGTLLVDGGTVDSTSGIRPNAQIPGSTARVVMTNGATFWIHGSGSSIRVGMDSIANATNILDIAAAGISTNATSQPGFILRLGSSVNVANLLAGGVLTVNNLGVDGSGANNTYFNFNGGKLVLATNTTAYAFMSGVGTVTVQPGGAIVDTVGNSGTIAQNLLDGGGGLVKLGTGVLTLSGANAYSGLTDVRSGTLAITGTGALPGWDTNGRYMVSNGAVLAVHNAVVEGDVATMLGTANFAAGAFLGFDTSSGDRTNTSVLGDTVNGALGIVKLGANALTLPVANNHTGGFKLESGTVRIGDNDALGAGGTLLLNGGALTATGSVARTVGRDFALGGNVSLGATAADTGAMTFTGAGDLGSVTRTLTVNSAVTMSGSLSGSAGLTKTGVGALTLSASNSYDGVTSIIGTGIVTITHGSALGSTLGGTFISNGCALRVQGDITVDEPFTVSGKGIATTGAIRSFGGHNVLNGDIGLLLAAQIQADGGCTLTLNGTVARVSGNTALTFTGSGTTIVNGVIGDLGTDVLTVGDAGVRYFSNLNTFSGQAQLNNGVIFVNTLFNQGVASSLGTGLTTPTIRFGNVGNGPGVLRYTGAATSTDRSVQLGNGTGIGDDGSGTIENLGSGALSFTAAAFNAPQAGAKCPRVLTLGGANTDANTIGGVIADNDVGAGGTVSLLKQGAGRWVLAGVSTFSGGTTVGGGTLQIDGELQNSGVVVSNGATLKGSGRVAGLITVLSGGMLAPGSSPGTLTISNNIAFTAGSTFSVELAGDLDGQYDRLVLAGASDMLTLGGATLQVDLLNNNYAVGTSFTGVISGFSGSPGTFNPAIQYQNATAFQGDGKSISVNYNAEDITLTVVPEPGSLGILGLVVAAYILRRRRG